MDRQGAQFLSSMQEAHHDATTIRRYRLRVSRRQVSLQLPRLAWWATRLESLTGPITVGKVGRVQSYGDDADEATDLVQPIHVNHEPGHRWSKGVEGLRVGVFGGPILRFDLCLPLLLSAETLL